ncbi:MAG TPA: NHL repeat-containing protein, partial [Solirubrobacterales bacterium]|nr:NHL repeat-containing protein [Solirubrobacterales bacterium]
MLALAGAALLAASLFPATSLADSRPSLLWQQPADLATGSSAGRMDDLRGMDASPTSGHIFAADRLNARIVELDVWGQFVKAWGWGVRDGSSALQTCGPGATPPSATCLPGIVGTGPGQMSSPVGIAVGADESIYVYEGEECVEGCSRPQNFRVQKFTPAGAFVLMFGGEVNKTRSAEVGTTPAERNLCIASSGDTCGIGVFDAAPPEPGAFSNRSDLDAIDVGPDGTIYVGDNERIQAFSPSGAFEEAIVGSLAGEKVRSLALDSAGSFFVTLSGSFLSSKPNVRKLNPAGVEGNVLAAVNPGALAIDAEGNVFAVDTIGGVAPGRLPRVVKFSPSGELLIPTEEESEAVKKAEEEGKDPPPAFAEAHLGAFPRLPSLATSSACGIEGTDLYVGSHYQNEGETYVTAYGPPPDPEICPPPPGAPTIAEQYATAVDPDGATVKAKINPRFWPDTTFHVEYGTGKCSEGGCPSSTPETELGSHANVPLTTKGVLLEGLAPNTTYRYRFVAVSSGGGPVVGVGPGEEEATFTTPPPPAPQRPDTCPNAAFRSGPSALLEDCRAYEMVSPLDKQNGDILALPDGNSNPAAYHQASLAGEGFAYSTFRAFGDAESAPYTSQYIARRTSSGWRSDGISPPRGVSLVSGEGLQTQYRYFSEDLCEGWLFHDSDPRLDEAAVEGFSNLYRRSNCGPLDYEAVTTTQPTCFAPRNFLPELQGVSADGEHAAFRVQDKLLASAASCTVGDSSNKHQCYMSGPEGQLRLISALPSGVASGAGCSIGSGGPLTMRYSTVETAVSGDGERVYWTNAAEGPGQIYVR